MKQPWLKRYGPHIAAVAICVLAIVIYFSPLLGGKVLKQHDVLQWKATYHEIDQFQHSSGERTFWTNSIFSGMPSYLIGPSFKGNFTGTILYHFSALVKSPVDTLLLLFICFYIMMLTFGAGPWLALAGGLAFMFSSFNFLNIDAGHVGKGNAIAFMPLVIAGIQITLRRHKIAGALLTGIALSFQLAAGHLQITYYLAIVILIWMIVELILAFRAGRIVHLLLCGLYLAIAAGCAVGTGITPLLTTEEYGKYSIRGASELTRKASGASTEDVASSGLDKDYALQWSNGVSEPFTLLIPNFHGGASSGELPVSSETYKLLKANNVPNPKQAVQNMPTYWGPQPFTAGPIYFGAVICFLFVLGIFVVRGSDRWWILIAAALSILLSMGKHFMPLTDLFFYHFPLYNKFRSVTFFLSVAQVMFPLLGMLALRNFLKGDIPQDKLKKALLYSFYIVAGLCAVFMLVPGMFFDFTGLADEQLPEQLRATLATDRESLLRTDAFRSLALVAITFGLLWALITKKLKQEYVVAAIALLIVFDLWQVDKRYLNDRDFESRKKNSDDQFPRSQADEAILQDKDPNYRVYNTTQRLDQDAMTSYWHKSIGGYHGAKMRRYQELIDHHLSRGNREAFNMLNVKYFIVQDSAGTLFPQLNPEAAGHAWFVKQPVLVENADAEIDSLAAFNLHEKAFIDRRFQEQLSGFNPQSDSAAVIRLTSYAPNKLTYEYEAAAPQIAVFSEIFYDKGWNAFVDGQPAPHFRCNYVLRGMVVPGGKHNIEFRFEPSVVKTGETIAYASSIALYGGILLVGGFLYFRSRRKDADPAGQ